MSVKDFGKKRILEEQEYREEEEEKEEEKQKEFSLNIRFPKRRSVYL